VPVHQLAVVLVPFSTEQAAMRPVVARDAALQARIDTLLFRFEQPDDEPMWGVDMDRGFAFDWAVVGGRWSGWGDEIRERLARQRLTVVPWTIPRFIQRNAVWSEDLTRVRLIRAVQPAAVLTPHGEWLEPKVSLLFPKTARERKAESDWRRLIRAVTAAYPSCLAVAVDYHF
jgi:hypothetical protein